MRTIRALPLSLVSEAHVLRLPQRLGEKLKTIRLRLALTPDEIAQFVGAQDAAEKVDQKWSAFWFAWTTREQR